MSMASPNTLPALECIYRDAALVVVHKPSGLLSVPGRTAPPAHCVVAQVQARWCANAREVHRLDMHTSGLMVLACTPEAHRTLSMAFASRQVEKHYVALVAGDVRACQGSGEGWVDAPLLCDWPRRPRQHIVLAGGKASLTRWHHMSLETHAGRTCTRLGLQPHTGRSHQLRLHCLALGHPILGDELYAPPLWQAAAETLCLHASELALPHPISGEPMRWACPPAF